MTRAVAALTVALVVAGALMARPAAAQSTPTITATNLSTGSATIVSGHVDTMVTVAGLDASDSYTITILAQGGLGFDPGVCRDGVRRYQVSGVTTVSLPEAGVSQRVYVCQQNSVASVRVEVVRDGQSSTAAAASYPVDAQAPSSATHTLTLLNLPAEVVEGDRVGWAYALEIEAGEADAVYHVSAQLDSPPAAASLGEACDGDTMTVLQAEYDAGTHESPMYLTACYPAVVVVRLTLSQLDEMAGVFVRLGAPVAQTVTVTGAPPPTVSLLGLTVDQVTAVSGMLNTRLTLAGLRERLTYIAAVTLSGGIGYDAGVCADLVRSYAITGRDEIELPAQPDTHEIHVCETGDAAVRVQVQRAGVGSLVWVFPVGATAVRVRPTLAVSGVPARINGLVDWTVTASDLDVEVPYSLQVTVPAGLSLDVGCSQRTRTYTISGVASYGAPPGDETLRLNPCVTGDHTVLVTLQTPGRDVVRSEVEVTVDELGVTVTMEKGLLLRPSVAALVAARRYDDVVLVVYHVDYFGGVAMLPAAADAWWVDGQVGDRSVASAQAVAYARGGWGYGLVALLTDEVLTQVTLTAAPGRYAEPLGVTEPVTAGGDLGRDLLLALRGLQSQPEWEGQSLVSGEWLASDGIAYAEAVVPGLRDRAPEIYSSRIVDLRSQSFAPTARTDQGILDVDALSGMTGSAARVSHLPEVTFRLLITAVIAIVAAGLAIKFGRSGLLALPVVALVLVGGTIIGFVPLALTLSIGLLSAIITGYALWGKRT